MTSTELQTAMSALAAVCDGASEQDGAGFSQSDVWHGHYLACLDADGWTDDAVQVAVFLAHKYHKQLDALGVSVTLDPTERPVPAWEAVRGRARVARGKAKEDAERALRQEAYQRALKGMTDAQRARAEHQAKLTPGYLTFGGERLLLYASKNRERVEAARTIPGRRFSYEPEAHDSFPLSSLGPVLNLCQRFGVIVEVDPEALGEKAAQQAQVELSRPHVTRQDGSTLMVEFPYDPAFLARFKASVSRYSPRFERAAAPYWTVSPGRDLFGVVQALTVLGLRVHPDLIAEADVDAALAPVREAQAQAALSAARDLAYAVSAPELPTPGVTTALMPHQYVPVHALVAHRRVLIADAPGLGKTLEAIACLSHLGTERALIICPSNLTQNWTAELEQHAPGAFPAFVCEGQTPTGISAGTRVVIAGWAILAHWADTLKDWNATAVIVDEAHYGKSAADLSGSARGKAAVTLCQNVREAGGLILALTGTPIVNRPKELLPLLDMLGALSDFGGAWEYKMRYCGAVQKNVPGVGLKWSFEGATHTEELHHRLVDSGLYIRRTKEMLIRAGSMARKTINGADAYAHDAERTPLRVTLTTEERREYDAAVLHFRDWVMSMAQQEAREQGVTLTSSLLQQIITRKTGSILPQIGVVRSILGRLKVPHVNAFVQTLIGSGEQVVIVAHHRAVVDAYANTYTGLKIQGGMGVPKVEAVKKVFNTSTVNQHPVLTLAIESGKTGHTLCLQRKNGAGPECARMVFAEEGYVPGDEEQAQDRIWRIGQSREVVITNIIAAGTLDEGLYVLRDSKRGATTSVIDGHGDVNTDSTVSYLTGWLMND